MPSYEIPKSERAAWGEALRRRRTACNIGQVALGYKIGISTNGVAQYEHGVIPSVIIAHNLAKALDWTVEEWAADAESILKSGKL